MSCLRMPSIVHTLCAHWTGIFSFRTSFATYYCDSRKKVLIFMALKKKNDMYCCGISYVL